MGLFRGRRLERGSALQEFVFSLGGGLALPRTIHGCSPPTSPMRISATSACRAAAVAWQAAMVPIPQPNGSTVNKMTFFQRNFDEWAGSTAIKHKPSGLFAMGNFSTSQSDDTNVRSASTPGQGAGHDRLGRSGRYSDEIGCWAPFGETAFWGGYGQVNDGWAPGSNGGGIAAIPALREIQLLRRWRQSRRRSLPTAS